ncbi:MAG: hypothetical protein P4L98_20560, partial [Ancalomicrobiaceae bacterium]|nr:hypothetical protein [Ancalomicrobiaceae bacterium]
MKRHFKATTALILFLGASPALAVSPAIETGKLPDALRQLFGDKLDPFIPAFSVSHAGDTTKVTIDFAMIAERTGIPGLSVSSKPFTL